MEGTRYVTDIITEAPIMPHFAIKIKDSETVVIKPINDFTISICKKLRAAKKCACRFENAMDKMPGDITISNGLTCLNSVPNTNL